MLANLILKRCFMFSKFILKNNKYLIPDVPKRGLSSYIIFSNQIRSKVQEQLGSSKSVAETSKKIGQKWAQVTEQEKKKYQEKAVALKEKADQEKRLYEQKYVEPFKHCTAIKLIQQKVKELNTEKVGGLSGFQAKLKEYRESLTKEQMTEIQNQAIRLNAQNKKIIQQYKVPQLEFTSLSSYLSSLRKKNQTIPLKRDLSEKRLDKYQNQYEALKDNFSEEMKNFTRKYQISDRDLIKLLKKGKSPAEKIAQQVIQIKGSSQKSGQTKNSVVKLQGQIKAMNQRIRKTEKQMEKKIKEKEHELQKAKNKLNKQKQAKTTLTQTQNAIASDQNVESPTKANSQFKSQNTSQGANKQENASSNAIQQ